MRVDVHCHVVPEALAEATVRYSERMVRIKAIAPMTTGALLTEMDASGIDVSVLLAGVADSSQVRERNGWAMGLKSPRFVVFGALHPDYPDCKGEIRRLKESGIKGVKLHTVFNRFYPDDERLLPIYEEIGGDMVVLVHAGGLRYESGEPIYGAPERIARVLTLFPSLKVIAAHFGGLLMLDQAREHLVGRNVYLDTSWAPSLRAIGDRTLVVKMIREHGASKILFGTDFPFSRQKDEVEYILELPLSEDEKKGILGENARELLRL